MNKTIEMSCLDVATKLKIKAIEDYDLIVKKLESGYNPKYDNILNIICFIDSKINDSYLAKALLNGK